MELNKIEEPTVSREGIVRDVPPFALSTSVHRPHLELRSSSITIDVKTYLTAD
jgi:hypothetical protein